MAKKISTAESEATNAVLREFLFKDFRETCALFRDRAMLGFLMRDPRNIAFYLQNLHKLSAKLGMQIPHDVQEIIRPLKAEVRFGRRLAESKLMRKGFTHREVLSQRSQVELRKKRKK